MPPLRTKLGLIRLERAQFVWQKRTPGLRDISGPSICEEQREAVKRAAKSGSAIAGLFPGSCCMVGVDSEHACDFVPSAARPPAVHPGLSPPLLDALSFELVVSLPTPGRVDNQCLAVTRMSTWLEMLLPAKTTDLSVVAAGSRLRTPLQEKLAVC